MKCPYCNYTVEYEYINNIELFAKFLDEAELSEEKNITFNQYCDVLEFIIINNINLKGDSL